MTFNIIDESSITNDQMKEVRLAMKDKAVVFSEDNFYNQVLKNGQWVLDEKEQKILYKA